MLRRITSRQHPRVKDLRQSFAHGDATRDGLHAIEGVRLIEEAIRAGLKIHTVIVSESADARARRLLPQLGAQVKALSVPDGVFASAVTTETPQGVAALVKFKTFTLDDVLREAEPLLVIAIGLQDPGNLGTLVRSAETFGAAGVLLAEKTVSQFNPKAVRAAAGSAFRLPIVNVKLSEAIAELKQRNVRLLGTSSHKGTSIDQTDLRGGVAIVIGNEGAGLDRDVLKQMDATIAIPHVRPVESLNAGVSASVVLYEAARQRKFTTETRRHGEEQDD